MRRSQEWPDIPEIGKIEEKNPEILAKKILETGRQIEATKYGTELTPRGQNVVAEKRAPLPEKNRNSNRPSRTSSNFLSKMSTPTQIQSQTPTPPPQPQQPCNNRTLTVSQADSTPRVNDFEDRLKNLITSVLNDKPKPPTSSPSTNDSVYLNSPLKQSAPKFVEPEREGLFARAPPKSALTIQHQQQQPDYTQFSPAKLALRRHLSQEKFCPSLYQQAKTSDLNYIRSIGDMVSGEIERRLESSSENNVNVPNPQNSATRQTYSPISRPSSTDCHATSTTSSCGNTDVNVVSFLSSVTTPSTEHVEGLAASLRDCLRTPAEEMLEQGNSSNSAAAPADTATEEPPAKKKRPSVDSTPEMSKEKKNIGETHTQKWQDKFDSRFDRIFTFASTEMDKRRRSTESCSPRTEPFSSPRGKELAPVMTNDSTSIEKTPERKCDSKPSEHSKKDKKEESKTSDKSREKSKDRDKTSRSKSSQREKERDKEKDKDKDKEHRKHSSSSSSSSRHSHEKKRADSSGVDKERDKDKVKDKNKDKDKKESKEKRSDDRSEKHKHRDKSKEKERHRDKNRDKEQKNSKETKLPKVKEEKKDGSNSGSDLATNSEIVLKQEQLNNAASRKQDTQPNQNVVDESCGQLLLNDNVKNEMDSVDERLHEHNSEGRHFKKRMCQSQMDWKTGEAESRKDERQHQASSTEVKLEPSPAPYPVPPVECKPLSSHTTVDDDSSVKKQYSKGKKEKAEWNSQMTSSGAQLSQTDQASAFSRTSSAMTTGASPHHLQSQNNNSSCGFGSSFGAPLPHSGPIPKFPPAPPPPSSVPMVNPYPSSAYGSLPTSEVSSQAFSRQFQQQSRNRSEPHHLPESSSAHYMTGLSTIVPIDNQNVTLLFCTFWQLRDLTSNNNTDFLLHLNPLLIPTEGPRHLVAILTVVLGTQWPSIITIQTLLFMAVILNKRGIRLLVLIKSL